MLMDAKAELAQNITEPEVINSPSRGHRRLLPRRLSILAATLGLTSLVLLSGACGFPKSGETNSISGSDDTPTGIYTGEGGMANLYLSTPLASLETARMDFLPTRQFLAEGISQEFQFEEASGAILRVYVWMIKKPENRNYTLGSMLGRLADPKPRDSFQFPWILDPIKPHTLSFSWKDWKYLLDKITIDGAKPPLDSITPYNPA